jgi:hypothetical protein
MGSIPWKIESTELHQFDPGEEKVPDPFSSCESLQGKWTIRTYRTS